MIEYELIIKIAFKSLILIQRVLSSNNLLLSETNSYKAYKNEILVRSENGIILTTCYMQISKYMTSTDGLHRPFD